jgi:hypothetical protein
MPVESASWLSREQNQRISREIQDWLVKSNNRTMTDWRVKYKVLAAIISLVYYLKWIGMVK